MSVKTIKKSGCPYQCGGTVGVYHVNDAPPGFLPYAVAHSMPYCDRFAIEDGDHTALLVMLTPSA